MLIESPASLPASLIKLLTRCLRACDAGQLRHLCNVSLLKIVLSAYGASLSHLDRALLELIVWFEEMMGLSILKAGMFWGSHARSLLLADSISTQECTELTTEMANDIKSQCLDERQLYHSALTYPLHRNLDVATPNPSDDGSDQPQIYDPSFLLPVLAELMSSPLFSFPAFLESNAFGFIVVSLSSDDRQIRKLASAMMSRITSAITRGSRRKVETALMTLLLYKFSSIPTAPAQRLQLSTTVFMMEASRIMFRPTHPLYMPVVQMFTSQHDVPSISIPMFSLLRSVDAADPEKNQMWLLRRINASIRTPQDYISLRRHYALEQLESLHDSPMTLHSPRKLIWAIHSTILHNLPSCLTDLVEKTGTFSWLLAHLEHPRPHL